MIESEGVRVATDDSKGPPENAVCLELGSSAFLIASRMFVERKSGASELLSRAVLLRVNPSLQAVCMESTDGVVRMRSTVSCPRVSAGFPLRCVLDVESLYRVANMRTGSLFIVYDKGDFYADFMGGRVFIPQYNIKSDILEYHDDPPVSGDKAVELVQAVKPSTGGDLFRVEPATLKDAVGVAGGYLSSVSSSDLAFAYFTPEAMLLANGSSVYRQAGSFGRFKFRRGDLGTISAAVSCNPKQVVQVRLTRERVTLSAEGYGLQVPYFDFVFSDSFVMMSHKAEEGYYVDTEVLSTALSVMDEKNTSGVLQFKSSNGVLVLSSFSREGKLSHVTLAKAKEPVGPFCISVAAHRLAPIMRALKPDPIVRVGVTTPNLVFNTDQKVGVVFGKVV